MIEQSLSFNWVDYTILGIVIFSALISLFRGFVREAISLIAWIAGLILALKYAPVLQSFIQNWSKSSSNLNDFSTHWTASASICYFLAFVVIFLGVVIFGMIINYFVVKLVSKVGLSFIDRLLGFVFGVARGVVIVAVLLLLVANYGTIKDNRALAGSKIAEQFKPLVSWMNNYLPTDLKSVTQWIANELNLKRNPEVG